MCGHVLGEVGLFCFALFFVVLCWACAVSTLAQLHPELYIIPMSALTFMEISMTCFISATTTTSRAATSIT